MQPRWLLPFAPRPCPGETFSSWLSRVACRYGFKAQELFTELLPDGRPGPSSEVRDRQIDRAQATCIADAARCDKASVAALDVALSRPGWPVDWFSWTSCGRDVWNERDIFDGRLTEAWCPACLIEGQAECGHDYLRVDWALACTGHCHRHAAPLVEHCTACGFGGRMMYSPEGSCTRLCCGRCWRPLSDLPSLSDRGPRRAPSAEHLIIRFEADLVCALDGKAPRNNWARRSEGAALLRLVRDVARTLSVDRGFKLRPLVEDFDVSHDRLRLPRLPSINNKLAALSAEWKRRMLPAVLAIISDEEICKALSVDLRYVDDP